MPVRPRLDRPSCERVGLAWVARTMNSEEAGLCSSIRSGCRCRRACQPIQGTLQAAGGTVSVSTCSLSLRPCPIRNCYSRNATGKGCATHQCFLYFPGVVTLCTGMRLYSERQQYAWVHLTFGLLWHIRVLLPLLGTLLPRPNWSPHRSNTNPLVDR